MYKLGCEALPFIYDLSSDKLHIFMQHLRNCANKANWMATLTFAPAAGEPAVNFLDNYGRVSMTAVQTHVATYQGNQTRDAQNAQQILECINNSLTESAQARIFVAPENYTRNDELDGLMLLKYVISLSYLDTNATTSNIKLRLSSLDQYIREKGSDIITFNTYVKAQRNSLSARGQQTTDLLVNLFKGYKAVSDRTFVNYIERKQDEYNDGNPNNITENKLMELAENKYKQLVEANVWDAPNEDQKKIIALAAQLESFKKAQATSKKATATTDTSTKSHRRAKSDRPPTGKPKKKYEVPAWKKVPPKQGERKEKDRDGKHYYWCPNH